MGCKLVGTDKGTKLRAGDRVASDQLRGSASATGTESLPARATGVVPPGQATVELGEVKMRIAPFNYQFPNSAEAGILGVG